MPQKLSDFIKHIKSIPHVVENEADLAFTREFEINHKAAIVSAIKKMSLEQITEAQLNLCHSPRYKFQEQIYSTECVMHYGSQFSKQFLYDIHILVEAQLDLTDFKIDVVKYADDGDPECRVCFYITELNDADKKPDYFEYFKLDTKTT